jgi:hypothetical protein
MAHGAWLDIKFACWLVLRQLCACNQKDNETAGAPPYQETLFLVHEFGASNPQSREAESVRFRLELLTWRNLSKERNAASLQSLQVGVLYLETPDHWQSLEVSNTLRRERTKKLHKTEFHQ